MILISHRGNIEGPNLEWENKPHYIDTAIAEGYDVEADVWCINGLFYLGHDNPYSSINKHTLNLWKNHLWIHAKNIEALFELKNEFNCFFHNMDDAVLTSDGYIWTYPSKKLTSKSICVLPERALYTEKELNGCAGICSDYIKKYKEK